MWLKVKGGAVINTNAIACIEESTASTAEVTLVNGRKFTLVYDKKMCERALQPDGRVDWEEYMISREYSDVYNALIDVIIDGVNDGASIPLCLDNSGLSAESIANNVSEIADRIADRLDSIDDSIIKGFKYIKNEL